MLKRIVHPGEILNEELQELGVSMHELARQIDMTAESLGEIVAGADPITADTALRLGHWFGVDPQFWMNLQSQHDLVIAERTIGTDLETMPSLAHA